MIPDRNNRNRRRPWDQVSWWFSLVLVIPLTLFAVWAVTSGSNDDSGLSGVVRDAFTGDPVSGAVVSTANATATTNGDGAFTLSDLTATSLVITRQDYASTQVAVTSPDLRYDVTLRPTTISGTVKNEKNGDPISGVTVTATAPDGTMITTETNDDGEYTLKEVPEGASVTVTYEGFTVATLPLGLEANLDFEIRPDVLTGLIVDEAGQPVSGAVITVGTATTSSATDGTYRIAGVPEDAEVTIQKAGYHEVSGDIEDTLRFDVTLTRFLVRAVHASAKAIGEDRSWNEILTIADSSEVNAVVLDLKDSTGSVYFDSNVALAAEISAEKPVFDAKARLADLQERNLYAIARIVVFQDPLLASARGDLAIHDVSSGDLWTTWDGLAWVNPYEPAVWQYNIDLAVEAARLGFDEIQLDYIRFPSDGLLENADFGPQHAEKSRVDAISGFLTAMQTALKPTGSLLAVNIAGVAMVEEDDAGIGQNFNAIAPLVDVVSPMIYPSHFYPGEMGFDIPNNHPYDVVLQSLQRGGNRVPEARDKLRPWLQDFSFGEGIEYGPTELAAQIQAAEDYGTTGWMVWADENGYSKSAFDVE